MTLVVQRPAKMEALVIKWETTTSSAHARDIGWAKLVTSQNVGGSRALQIFQVVRSIRSSSSLLLRKLLASQDGVSCVNVDQSR